MKQTKKDQVWVVGKTTFTKQAAAYRECRRLNGTKAGGKRPFKVERKNA